MLNDKFPEKLISALGTATLAAVFALWCAGSSYGAAGYAADVIPLEQHEQHRDRQGDQHRSGAKPRWISKSTMASDTPIW